MSIKKSASQILMFNTLEMLLSGMTIYPSILFPQNVESFIPSIMEKRTFNEMKVFRKYGGSILRPFKVHPKYPFFHVFIAQANDF